MAGAHHALICCFSVTKPTTEFIQSPIKERKELKEKEGLNPLMLQEGVRYGIKFKSEGCWSFLAFYESSK